MINGTLKMTFDDNHVSVDTDIQLNGGTAAKCFILECVCKALELEGLEKTIALAAVASRKNASEEEKTE